MKVNLATLKKCLRDLDACTTKNRYDVLTEVMDHVLGMEGALRQRRCDYNCFHILCGFIDELTGGTWRDGQKKQGDAEASP